MAGRVKKSTPAVISDADPKPRSRYGRWRAGTLLFVYVLMAAHITHWIVTGKTLAPLELNEVMYTFELGIVTAGFLFMAVAVLATAIFGRFFCSWGCHILALQDLCAWILEKLRIRPKAVRSRLLLWVPLAAMLYMFVWPQVVRVYEGRPLPTLHFADDADGWASFATTDFWRNLPSPAVALVTFVVVGFVAVYVLGTRGFCAYGCPYGALFALVDRVAPGKIRVGDDCTACGTCTAVCTSNVRVHEEVNRYGMVVNPACLKDLDCVSACPQQTLRFGFGRPSLAKTIVGDTVVRKRYDFTLAEDVFMAGVFLVILVVYRGLYELVPFLMAIALGVIGAYMSVVLLRLGRRKIVAFNRWHLKRGGRLNGRGWAFAGVTSALILLTGHSAFVRYHEMQGSKHYRLAMHASGDPSEHQARAIHHFVTADAWGLLSTERVASSLGRLHVERQEWDAATHYLTRLASRRPSDPTIRVSLAGAMVGQGKMDLADEQFRAALALDPQRAESHYAFAGFCFKMGRSDDAALHLAEALRWRPQFPEAHAEWGVLKLETGDLAGGVEHLRTAIEMKPGYGDAHYNLAVALAMGGRLDEAAEEIDLALNIQPDDDRTQAFHRHLAGMRSGG